MIELGAAPKDDSRFSQAKAVYGTHLSLPGKFIEYSDPSMIIGESVV